MVNLGIISGHSSSDDEAICDWELGPGTSTSSRSRFLSSPSFLHAKYVWDQNDSDDEERECSTNMGATQQRFLDSLRDSVDVDACLPSGAVSVKSYADFLEQDALSRRKLEGDQRRMLSNIEARHRELHARDQEAVKRVVTRFQAELAQKERLDLEKQREAERRAQERVKQEEQLKAQLERDKEAQITALESERALYRLVRMASAEALEHQRELGDLLARYDSELMDFCENMSPETKNVRRSIKKFVTLSVQQISATQEQVRRKSSDILEFLAQQHGIHQKFALVTLASKIISQCDAQIARLPSFAFPLAEVAVRIGCANPDFVKLLLAMLQNECPLCIPMIVKPGPKGGKDIKYYEALQFKVTDGKVENEEEYVSRLQGFVRLYAAVLQVDSESQLMETSLGQAWSYAAWLLNTLPACRYTASALDAFLSVAGYRMSGRFGRQFGKMMTYVENFFLKELSHLADADANAVATRLESYVGSQLYRSEPKGRTMPVRDISSQNRA